MNLQPIDRLQALLARVELRAKMPRQVVREVAAPAAPAPVPAIAAPAPAPAPVVTQVASVPPVSLAPEELQSAPAVSAPLASAPEPQFDEPELEDMDLDDLAVELSPEMPPAEAAASASAPMDELEELGAVQDAESEGMALEDVSFEDIAAEAAPDISSPARTAVNASPAPFTAPPSLDDLTFSEPPPPRVAESVPPPVSSRQAISEAPDSIDAALMAATQAQAEAEDAEERDAPLLTPPPESGQQPARPSAASAEEAPYRQTSPTIEQLGDVLELEEPRGPDLELMDAAPATTTHEPEELEFVPQASVRVPITPELEASSPREAMPTLAGAFEDELPPASSEIPVSVAPPPVSEPVASTGPDTLVNEQAATAAPTEAAFEEETPTSVLSKSLTAEATTRQVTGSSQPIIDVVARAQGYRPKSFLELLDASLELGKR